MLCCCYANTNRGELLSNLSFFFFFFLFCFITLKKYSQSGHMHFKMCIKVMIPLRTSFKREHFIFYKLSDFLCFGSFFFFFSLPSCWLYNLHSGLVFGRRGRKRGEGAGSKTTEVKKLGFKQMELNPKVNTWRGKVLRPVPRCLSGAWSSCLSFWRPCKQVRAATHHREVQSLGYFFPRHLCGSLPETDLRTISTKSS